MGRKPSAKYYVDRANPDRIVLIKSDGSQQTITRAQFADTANRWNLTQVTAPTPSGKNQTAPRGAGSRNAHDINVRNANRNNPRPGTRIMPPGHRSRTDMFIEPGEPGFDTGALDIDEALGGLGDLLGGGGGGSGAVGPTAEELARIVAETGLLNLQAEYLPKEFDEKVFMNRIEAGLSEGLPIWGFREGVRQFDVTAGLEDRRVDELEAAGAFTRGPEFEQRKTEAAAEVLSQLLAGRLNDIANMRGTAVDTLRTVLPISTDDNTSAALGRMFAGVNEGGPLSSQEIPVNLDVLANPVDIAGEVDSLDDIARGFFGMADGGIVEAADGVAISPDSIEALIGFDPLLQSLLGGVNSINTLGQLFGDIPSDLVDQLLAPILPPGRSSGLGGQTFASRQWQDQLGLQNRGLDIDEVRARASQTQADAAMADVGASIDRANIAANASRYGADQGLAGTRYAADQGLAGTRYSADRGLEGVLAGVRGRAIADLLGEESRRAQIIGELRANPRNLFQTLYTQAEMQNSPIGRQLDEFMTPRLNQIDVDQILGTFASAPAPAAAAQSASTTTTRRRNNTNPSRYSPAAYGGRGAS